MFKKLREARIIRRNLAAAYFERNEARVWAGTSRAKATDAFVLSATVEEVALAIGRGEL